MESKGKNKKKTTFDKTRVNNDKGQEFINKKRSFSMSSLFNVVKYSIEGYIHFYKYERSAILHLIVAVMVIIGSIPFRLSSIEWLFMIFILLTMLAIELLNTAIEAVCDLVSPEYNKLIKVAKDSASAATFSISVALIIAILILYVPKVVTFLGNVF